MSNADKVLEAMKAAGKPVGASDISKMIGMEKADVDKAMAELKKADAIESPVRCKWAPKA